MNTQKFSILLTLCLLFQTAANPADTFDGRFVRLYGSGSFISLNDEGTPYRFGLGAGVPVRNDRIVFITDLVYSYYDVNATADEHPFGGVEGGRSASLGIDLSFRWELFQGEYITGFVSGGGGFQNMISSPPFPADGSERNFTLFGGPGLLIPAGENTRISLSLRFFHISNAWMFHNNSGYDGIQLVVGSEWDWK